MSDQDSHRFYSNLPVHKMSASQLVAHEAYFQQVPEDWHVIITDIQGSTQAVNKGQQQIVNLVASGSIIAALNLGRTAGTAIPFFFGGDGATLLVPPALLNLSMKALLKHRENTARNYQLNLRVGQVPVKEIYKQNHDLRLAKTRLGNNISVPVVLGNGLKFAEKVIKAEQFDLPENPDQDTELNLDGMECRWNLIKPPEDTPEVVCLLVEVKDQKKHAQIFSQVLQTIDDIYGPEEKRNPVSISKLKLKTSLFRMADETRIRFGRFKLSYFLTHLFYTFFGFVYFRFYDSGKKYLHDLVDLSDTLVLDGRINTVISGTSKQRRLLSEVLEKMEQRGEVLFGLHVSQESVMSCYVRNREDEHIHFVDGSQGGYTQAARMLKGKMG